MNEESKIMFSPAFRESAENFHKLRAHGRRNDTCTATGIRLVTWSTAAWGFSRGWVFGEPGRIPTDVEASGEVKVRDCCGLGGNIVLSL